MRLTIGVVCGGKSVEHEVSIISALQMVENMDKERYNPIIIYLSKGNEFYYSEEMKDIEFFKNAENIHQAKKIIFRKKDNLLEMLEVKKNKLKKIQEIDLIFLVVHGTNCEDGTLAAYFEMFDIPYVGSNILSSALNQNKWKMKQILQHNNIPVVKYVGFYENDFYQEETKILDECEELGYPLIVKPSSLGSSVGITKCSNREKLHKAILTALMYDREIVVEKALSNFIEVNVSVLGNSNRLSASEIEKVIQEDEILSYKDKYLRGGKISSKGMVSTRRELPAKIDHILANDIKEIAINAVKIIGGSGVSRIDFLYDLDEKEVYLNEVNTIPGSLAFYLWKACNIEYSELIDRLIKIALEDYRSKHGKIFSYDTNILNIPKGLHKGKLK